MVNKDVYIIVILSLAHQHNARRRE